MGRVGESVDGKPVDGMVSIVSVSVKSSAVSPIGSEPEAAAGVVFDGGPSGVASVVGWPSVLVAKNSSAVSPTGSVRGAATGAVTAVSVASVLGWPNTARSREARRRKPAAER